MQADACFRVLEDLVRILIELLCGLAAEAKERVLRQFVPRDVREMTRIRVFRVSSAVWKTTRLGVRVRARMLARETLRLTSSPRNER